MTRIIQGTCIGALLGVILGQAWFLLGFLFEPPPSRHHWYQTLTFQQAFWLQGLPMMADGLIWGGLLGGIVGPVARLCRRKPRREPEPPLSPDDTVWPPPPSTRT